MSKITIKHAEPVAGKINTEIFNSKLTIAEVKANTVTAAALDSWARGYVALSKDSYGDVEISEVLSINEELQN